MCKDDPQEAPGAGQPEQFPGKAPAAGSLGRPGLAVKWIATAREWEIIRSLLLWLIGVMAGVILWLLMAQRLGW